MSMQTPLLMCIAENQLNAPTVMSSTVKASVVTQPYMMPLLSEMPTSGELKCIDCSLCSIPNIKHHLPPPFPTLVNRNRPSSQLSERFGNWHGRYGDLCYTQEISKKDGFYTRVCPQGVSTRNRRKYACTTM